MNVKTDGFRTNTRSAIEKLGVSHDRLTIISVSFPAFTELKFQLTITKIIMHFALAAYSSF